MIIATKEFGDEIQEFEPIETTSPDLSKYPTKSAKIRYLDSIGWSRKQIALELGIRYQHVRNVLVTQLTTK